MHDEDRLVEEVLQGRHASFELLVKPYRTGFLNMAYRITGNIEEAREVCQEALLRMFRYLKAFRKGRSFKTWAYRILLNTSYDHLKERKKFDRAVESQKERVLFHDSDQETRVFRREIAERIQGLLEVLTPKERAVFLLRDGEDFSVEETARTIGCSPLSVRTHLCRARKKIRKELERDFFREPGQEET